MFCLQEMKANVEDVPEESGATEKPVPTLPSGRRKGYAGTALWSKQKPVNVIKEFMSVSSTVKAATEADFSHVAVGFALPALGAARPERQATSGPLSGRVPKICQALRKR